MAREAGEAALTDELLGAVVEAVRPARPRGHGEAWERCEAERDRIAGWPEDGVYVVKVHDLLARRGVVVPERTLQRFCSDELGYRKQKTTVRGRDRPRPLPPREALAARRGWRCAGPPRACSPPRRSSAA